MTDLELKLAIDKCSIKIHEMADVETLILRGVLYDCNRKYQLAIKDFNTALEKSNKGSDILYLRAYSFLNKGDFNAAISDFKKASGMSELDIDPSNERNMQYGINFICSKRNSILDRIINELKMKGLTEFYGLSNDFVLN